MNIPNKLVWPALGLIPILLVFLCNGGCSLWDRTPYDAAKPTTFEYAAAGASNASAAVTAAAPVAAIVSPAAAPVAAVVGLTAANFREELAIQRAQIKSDIEAAALSGHPKTRGEVDWANVAAILTSAAAAFGAGKFHKAEPSPGAPANAPA